MENPIIELNSEGRYVNIVTCDAGGKGCPPFVILERREDDLVCCPTCKTWHSEGPDILAGELIEVLRYYDSKTTT